MIKNTYPIHLERELAQIYLKSIESIHQFVLKYLLPLYRARLKEIKEDPATASADMADLAVDYQSDTGEQADIHQLVKELAEKRPDLEKIGKVNAEYQVFQDIRKTFSKVNEYSSEHVMRANIAYSDIPGHTGQVLVRQPGSLNMDLVKNVRGIETTLDKYAKENASLITTTRREYMGGISKTIQDGLLSSKSTATIRKELQALTGATKNRAQFWARDQMGKLNGQVEMTRQMAAGYPGYIWMTSQDNRVRDTHASRHGIYYPWTHGGLKPGEDYNCRCSPEPAFGPTDALPEHERAVAVKEMTQERVVFGEPEIIDTSVKYFDPTPADQVMTMSGDKVLEILAQNNVKFRGMMSTTEMRTILMEPWQAQVISRAVVIRSRAQLPAILKMMDPAKAARSAELPKEYKAVQDELEAVATRSLNLHPDFSDEQTKAWLKDELVVHYHPADIKLMYDSGLKIEFLKFNSQCTFSAQRDWGGLYGGTENKLAVVFKRADQMVGNPLRNREVLTHELGHFFDYQQLRVTGQYTFERFSLSPALGKDERFSIYQMVGRNLRAARKRAMDAYEKSMAYRPQGDWKKKWIVFARAGIHVQGNVITTGCSLREPCEFFAEACSQYAINPTLLERIEPEMYELVKTKIYKGRMFKGTK